MNFEEAFNRLINIEKGFTKDPKDPGNWTGGVCGRGILKGTKYGIAANTYPDLDIENLTLEKAKEIYRRDWWMKLGADELDPAIVFQVWDFAVNAGMSTAKRKLQSAAFVAEDGNIGPLTIAAIKKVGTQDILLRFNARKLRHYTSLSKWAEYGKGWTNRTADNLDYAAIDN